MNRNYEEKLLQKIVCEIIRENYEKLRFIGILACPKKLKIYLFHFICYILQSYIKSFLYPFSPCHCSLFSITAFFCYNVFNNAVTIFFLSPMVSTFKSLKGFHNSFFSLYLSISLALLRSLSLSIFITFSLSLSFFPLTAYLWWFLSLLQL